MAEQATKPKRRTQAQRREAGRLALIEATIVELIEHGFASTTTPRVVRRASVTTGAIQHHFGSKNALFVDVLNHLLGEFREKMEELPDSGSTFAIRVTEAVETLRSLYVSDRYAAALSLITGAQSDPQLAHLVNEQRKGAIETVRQKWLETFSDAACSSRRLLSHLQIITATLRDYHFIATIDPEGAETQTQINLVMLAANLLAELEENGKAPK